MTTWRLLKPILILPGNVLVVVPALILWAADGTAYGAAPISAGDFSLWLGFAVGLVAMVPMVWTAALFVTKGQGTPAPWDPPRKLVILSPYRHVRNPMISGVICFLGAEALVTGSWAVAGWMAFFIAANTIYMPLSEEPGLERRFSEPYRSYKQNVPRWIPRLTPWPQEEQDGGGGD
jgi:protein-S-isoprenylcysteine O-methyltransferase Ste14